MKQLSEIIEAQPTQKSKSIFFVRNKILLHLCHKAGISVSEYKEKNRKGEIPVIRFIIYRELRKLGFSFDAIGMASNRTHSTVIYGINKLESLLSVNDKVAVEAVQLFEKSIVVPNINLEIFGENDYFKD